MADRHAVSGTTRVAAVIGHPVRHSLSPTIHNAAFAAAGLDWVYAAFDVAPGAAQRAVEAMRTLGLGGLSVTMPHKQAVAAAVDRLAPEAAVLSAVNTVAWDGDRLVGHSTDGPGLIDAIVEGTGAGVDGCSVVVLGAGGAARSVVLALADAEAARVGVWNRTPARAADTAALAGDAGAVVDIEACRDADIVVNATSVGMIGGDAEGQTPLSADLLRSGQIVVDLVYHPVRTPLLEATAIAGGTPVDGVGMLVHQAARQFALWTGGPAPLEAMRDAARSSIGAAATTE